MQRGWQKDFDALCAPSSTLLILGSYPSPKSFETGFFYGHPQNRFWPLMAALLGAPVPTTIDQKRALILENNLALWDSLERCTIEGASDGSIRNALPNDIPALVRGSNIRAIACNGAAAHRYYNQFSRAGAGIEAIQLPSTSPANAAWGFERLRAAWGEALKSHLPAAPGARQG